MSTSALCYTQEIIQEFGPGPITRVEWSNGAVLLHHKSPGFARAYFTVTIYGGSCSENIPGMTHYLEHMLFKRKESLNSNSIHQDPVRMIEALGGDLNAFTSKEYTCFELSSPCSRIKLLLNEFLAIVLKPNFNEELANKEKKVIIQEIREDNEDYELFGKEVLFQKVFHPPLGRPIAGTISSVKSIEYPHLKKYLKANFIPSHMVFTLVGDLPTPSIIKLLDDHFHTLKLSQKQIPFRPTLTLSMNNLKAASHSHVRRDVRLSCIIVSLPGVPIGHPYLFEHYFLCSYLTEGMSSLLYEEFRHKKPILYGISGHINCFKDAGNIEITLSCEEKQIHKIKKRINEIIEHLATNPIKINDMAKVKRQMLDAWELKFDDLEERNHHIYLNEIYHTQHYSQKRIEQKINNINQERIFVVTKNIAKIGPSLVTVSR